MTRPATRVDVVIPTRNRSAMVAERVRMALSQRDVDVSCIVVDDASDDDTAEVLRALGDRRVTVIVNEQRTGPAVARNRGIATSSAPWVAFLDDDDLWAPGKLAMQLAALRDAPGARWSATACVRIDENGAILAVQRLRGGGGEVFERLLDHCVIPAGCSTVLAERALLAESGGFDPEMRTVEDWPLWLELARRSPVAYVDEPLAAYTRWSGSRSRDLDDMERFQARVRESFATERRHLGLRDGGPIDVAPIRHQHRARAAARDGRRFVAAGTFVKAAVRGRAPGQVLYAAAALVRPSLVTDRLDRMDRVAIEPALLESARAWLEAPAMEDR